MELIPTAIDDVIVIEPTVHGDDRGFFLESWNARRFAAAGLDMPFVQDNHSRSARGVLRGLHYQRPFPQGKLVRAIRGSVYDVMVDLRRSSATFGRWAAIELSAANQRILWVGPGMAHGFLALEDDSEITYKCTDYYHPEHEQTLLWSDPALAIAWPLDGITPRLSAKDEAGLPLARTRGFE